MLSSIGNYYERLVMERIHDTLLQQDGAADSDYVDDLACVALNYLPPRYVRYAIDLAAHLTDQEHATMREEVADAVGFAIATLQRRRAARDNEQPD